MNHNQNWSIDNFAQNGFARVINTVTVDEIDTLLLAIEAISRDQKQSASAGVRHLLRRCPEVKRFANSRAMREIASSVIGENAQPVKAILFDKTPDANWYVTWHQDLTIAVKERIDKPGYGPWSVKDGLPHVQPPAIILQQVVSLRIHLDDCSLENGPIKFIAGSHAVGVMDTAQIAAWKTEHEPICCTASRGDIILMRPLILHSSSQATAPDHRRVLHIEYVATDLPGGLEWADGSSLDTVELLLAIEEEFGLDIPNEHAEGLYSVRLMYEYLKGRLAEVPPRECLSQKLFYKLRRALVENYHLERRSITPETKMTDLLSLELIEQGWPFVQLLIDLKTPPFQTANKILGFTVSNYELSLRQIVQSLIDLNAEALFQDPSSDDEIWNRLLDVIVGQANVQRHEITPQSHFTRDLGMC